MAGGIMMSDPALSGGGGLSGLGIDAAKQAEMAGQYSAAADITRQRFNDNVKAQNKAGIQELGSAVGTVAGSVLGGPVGGALGGALGGMMAGSLS